MNWIVKLFVWGIFLIVGVPMLIIGGLFAWNMIGQVEEARFQSPSGTRVLELRHDCRFVGCQTFASVEYEIDGKKAQMFCKPFVPSNDRFVLAGNPSVKWTDSETKIIWQEQAPADGGQDRLSGSFDLVEKCNHQDQFVEKGWPLSFRFLENCLGPTCRREMVLWYSGEDYLLVPCTVNDPSTGLVFSTGKEGVPNMEVEYDHDAQRATWKSLSTGRTGVVDLKNDCDRSRRWRETPPA